MEVHPVVVALALLFVVGAVGGVQQLICLRRALRGERAVRRLEASAHHSDTDALFKRIEKIALDEQVLEAADLILDSALAVHHRNEGGPL